MTLDLQSVIAELIETLEQCRTVAQSKDKPAYRRTQEIAKLATATLNKVTP
jgi:hypothetical protein